MLISAAILTGILIIVIAFVVVYTADEDENDEGQTVTELGEQVLANAANSDDECVVCHANHTPGIVVQYGGSDHYANNVSCAECHKVDETYPGATQHPDEDFYVLARSSPERCEVCHRAQVDQFNLSRHSLPAYVAYAGTDVLNEEQLAMYEAIPEGGFLEGGRERNAIYHLEGSAVTRFACEGCHNVGKPNPDGSIGDCTSCHLRHEFNLVQARKPETCNACHIGPDHPQWEIYEESPHGIAYATGSDDWHWDAEPGTLTTEDFPAPVCATCHFSGFGSSGTTHDVGQRLTWYLFSTVSTRRPNYTENKVEMQGVCQACHSSNFIEEFYTDGDAIVEAVNNWVLLSQAMISPLQENGLMTSAPFDEPIDYVFFNLWHHWGRTAKFGAWMQGPDYVQWHGAYEVMHELAELKDLVNEKLEAAGLEPLELAEGFPSNESAASFLAQQADAEAAGDSDVEDSESDNTEVEGSDAEATTEAATDDE